MEPEPPLLSDINVTRNRMRNELRLVGVPEHPYENLAHIAILAAYKLGVDLRECDIDWITRLGPPVYKQAQGKERPPRPIVLRLLWKTKRDQLLNTAKAKRNVTTEDLGLPGPPQSVSFFERVTKGDRLLYVAAKKKVPELGLARCFVGPGGMVYVIKKQGEAPVRIRNLEELEKLTPLKEEGPKFEHIAREAEGFPSARGTILEYKYL